MKRISLDFFFIAKHNINGKVSFHDHNTLEIVYYLQGNGETTIGNNTYQFNKNSFTIVPKGVRHDQKNNKELVNGCIGVSGSGLENLIGAYQDSFGVLRNEFLLLADELENKEPGYAIIADGILLKIIGTIRRIASSAAQSASKEAIAERAVALIREKEGVISVEDLSGMFYIRSDYFGRLFKEYTKKTPIQYILDVKLDKAKDLLTDTSLTISAIAQRCGFEDVYYFSKFFKKRIGVTPTVFRKSAAHE